MLFKQSLVRMNVQCAALVANVTNEDATRDCAPPGERIHYHDEVILAKRVKLNLIKPLQSKYQVLENAKDRVMLNCNMVI